MNKKPKLLGIDIDGVFNICSMDHIENDINRTPVHFLNKILEVVPECEVLITSSWGNTNNKTVNALVKAGFKYPERVVGNTGFISGEHSRTKEIVEWLNEYDRQDYYETKVYIDDEISLFNYHTDGANKYCVVECRGDIGLNIDKAYETICRLQGINLKFWS